jgi:hypothetical protein
LNPFDECGAVVVRNGYDVQTAVDRGAHPIRGGSIGVSEVM